MVNRIAVVIFLLCMVVQCAFCATEEPIGSMYQDKMPVKVYIKGFTDESGNKLISSESFKKAIEDGLLNRKSMTFKIVDDPAQSAIQISGVIKRYQYLERGPIKLSVGVGTLIADAAATATMNYADMVVDFTVTDTKTNKVVWNDTIESYIKKIMTPEQSVPFVYGKMTREFLWKCLGKPKKAGHTFDMI
ncbi:MAG: hypothetical protein PHP46_00980 [Candidatus Omnitrophica bacterium]|nr:hypothetical protein [Candidatus Omnitrophota bacterium]